MAQDQGNLCGTLGKLGVQRDIETVGNEDASGLTFNAEVAHGQTGVVLAYGSATDHHRVMAASHAVHHTTGGGTGDPLAFARCCGNTTVKARGQLEGKHWAALVDA